MMKAIPGAGGMGWKKFSSARSPPADAPMPTTGNGAALFSGLIANFEAQFRAKLLKLIRSLFLPAGFAMWPMVLRLAKADCDAHRSRVSC